MTEAESPAPSFVPGALRIQRLPGTCALSEGTEVYGGDGRASGLLREILRALAPVSPANDVTVMLEIGPVLSGRTEAYRLEIRPEHILIEGSTEEALMHGVQRIHQLLLESPLLPCCVVEDAPHLPWRGGHIDVARNFVPMAWLHRYVELLALHGLNALHLHLSDDQGWRMEIKRYPRLAEVGGWRERTMLRADPPEFDETRCGGFYTQVELRGLVEFAASRGIEIVPEIDMPGHMSAAIAAYPELGTTGEALPVPGHWGVLDGVLNVDDATVAFMQGVLEEVLDVFPSRFIHIGGDEVPQGPWEASASAQARIASEGLRDGRALYGWFMRQMAKWLVQHGRRPVVWDEAVGVGLPTQTVIMAWRDQQAAARAAFDGYDVVMAPRHYTYFDYYQSRERESEPLAIGGHIPLERVLELQPVPPAMAMATRRRIIGTQFQLWTEFLRTPEQIEYMAFPRACALAEVAWREGDFTDAAEFRTRLARHLKRLDRLNVNYRPLDPG